MSVGGVADLLVRDISSLDQMAPESQQLDELLYCFLAQFRELTLKWGWELFSGPTLDLVEHCAEYQRDLLIRMSEKPKDLLSESTIMAQTLHCFVVAMNLGYASSNGPLLDPMTPQDSGRIGICYLDEYCGVVPAVDFWKSTTTIPSASATRTLFQQGESLVLLLKNIIKTAQRMMLRDDPGDWPVLLYVLVLLAIINGYHIWSGVSWVKQMDAVSKALDDALRKLCRLYTFCTNGRHPFACRWDPKEYEVLAGDNQLTVRHFYKLRSLWLELGKGTAP